MILLGHFSEFNWIVSPTVCQASLVGLVEWNCSNSGCLLIFNSVGFTLHNLASTYLQQRKFEEARSCYEVFSFDGTQKILSLVNWKFPWNFSWLHCWATHSCLHILWLFPLLLEFFERFGTVVPFTQLTVLMVWGVEHVFPVNFTHQRSLRVRTYNAWNYPEIDFVE